METVVRNRRRREGNAKGGRASSLAGLSRVLEQCEHRSRACRPPLLPSCPSRMRDPYTMIQRRTISRTLQAMGTGCWCYEEIKVLTW